MMKNKDFFRELVASAPEHAEKPQPILTCIDFSDATAGVIGGGVECDGRNQGGVQPLASRLPPPAGAS